MKVEVRLSLDDIAKVLAGAMVGEYVGSKGGVRFPDKAESLNLYHALDDGHIVVSWDRTLTE